MALVPQFLTLLLTVAVSFGDDNLCPPREDIYPCTCYKGHPDVNVACGALKGTMVWKLRKPLQSVKGLRGVRLSFQHCTLGSVVPSDLFAGLHVTRLSFMNSELTGIGDEGRSALEGLEDTIEYFEVSSSFSEENGLRFLNVSRLHKLEELHIDENNLKELGNEWFAEGLANLKFLYARGNGIEIVGDKAFARLRNIRVLGLGQNGIRTPKRSMFPSPAVHLASLSLSDNRILNLPVDLFSNMPALKSLQLRGNFLRRIPQVTWSLVWSGLKSLDIEDNPLVCDAYIEWTFRRPRPYFLDGACYLLEEKKKLQLEKLIDGKRREKQRQVR